MASKKERCTMALDDREYILNRRGWNPAKLTGMRKNPEIYNPKEFRRDQQTVQDYDRLPEFNYREALARWTIVLGVLWIAYAVWYIWKISVF